ncbi:MAG: hypothetical protein OHK0028_13610 [Deltaproteobacteria bacterium]
MMLDGRRLTRLSAVAAAACIAGAIGVAATGELRLPPAADAQAVGPAAFDPARVAAELALARDAESAGDVPGALAHYRAAALLDPRIVDPRAPVFLGPAFEAWLKTRVAEQRRGGAAPAQARSDAAYLFRRMYGGCG